MSVIYFGKSNTPVNKQVMGLDMTTTATIWTPTSGKKISLTDLVVSATNQGTIRLYFLPDGDTTSTPTLVFEQLISSAVVSFKFDTPKVNSSDDGILRAVSGANGNVWINIGGLEL